MIDANAIQQAFESGDPEQIKAELYIAVRVKGVQNVANETGLSRFSLYKALKPEGNPSLSTLLGILKSLDINLTTK